MSGVQCSIECKTLCRVIHIQLEERLHKVVSVQQGDVIVDNVSDIEPDLIEAQSLDLAAPGERGKEAIDLLARISEP